MQYDYMFCIAYRTLLSLNYRWGVECYGVHGGYYTHHDRFNPGVLQEHKFENSMTIDKGAWGIRSNIHVAKILSMDVLIYEIVSTGLNLLVSYIGIV